MNTRRYRGIDGTITFRRGSRVEDDPTIPAVDVSLNVSELFAILCLDRPAIDRCEATLKAGPELLSTILDAKSVANMRRVARVLPEHLKTRARDMWLAMRELVPIACAESAAKLAERWDAAVIRHAQKGGKRKRKATSNEK
ncbi:MAG TPA: hypothetical protein VK459_03710 [Polyangiaceae bacterium]|nr:hypothetical protein [Polyangiaceae bacterium]